MTTNSERMLDIAHCLIARNINFVTSLVDFIRPLRRPLRQYPYRVSKVEFVPFRASRRHKWSYSRPISQSTVNVLFRQRRSLHRS